MTGTVIRLLGIDAPEEKQTCQRDGIDWPCGREAKQQLAALVDGKQIYCQQQGSDRSGHIVAVCTAGEIDLAQALASAGLALALPAETQDYAMPAARAKQFKLGIWSSEFTEPALWRAAHPDSEPKPTPTLQATRPPQRAQRVYRNHFGCAIKGNRNRKGEWIYHLPGMPYYDATRPEDLFCTEAEAQAAGYRRAIVR
ncbi:thermonuclease family protein [Croceicoccus estronivorus]|uniref:thermonuclease family protein n=1 Tax=Croceicoccus estronivorus TaxID=1172626 RepID=UPI0014787F74|nr:thermonuclease family protein [Croceicoccus estronivorus]